LCLTRDIGFQKPTIAGLALMSPVHLGKNLPPSFVQPLTDLDKNHCSKGPSWLPEAVQQGQDFNGLQQYNPESSLQPITGFGSWSLATSFSTFA